MAQREANWIDGIRGVASFWVVTGHICTAFFPWLQFPGNSDGSFSIFQLPFFRLLVGGRTAVALFFIISAYVNSVGTIKRNTEGNSDAAFQGLARSAFGRIGRLVIPSTIATTIAWAMAQLNLFGMAKHVDATWIRQGYSAPDSSILAALKRLVHALVSTWTTGRNLYDGTQWTLVEFLQLSMIVYAILMIISLLRPRARRLVIICFYIYGWVCPQKGTTVRNCNLAFGLLLAELQVELGAGATNYLPRILPPIMFILTLFIAGYPMASYERMGWSNAMEKIMSAITPKESDNRRHWDSWAACLLVLTAFFSARFRRILSNRVFNFLGRVSFPVYLIHNQLMKSVLVWMVYFPSYFNPLPDQKELVRAPPLHLAVSILIFYAILYRLAYTWVTYLDPIIGRVLKSITNWATDTATPIEKSITAATDREASTTAASSRTN